MIERYTRPRMARIWDEEQKFKNMLKVEILACEAQSKLKIIPKGALFEIKKKSKFNVERIKEIEKKTNHDVVAFIANLSENIGDAAKYIHLGLTSSDILDTSLSLMMRDAMDVLVDDAKKLLAAFKRKARRFRYSPMVGRSHGMHAEPTSFGLKMALFYDETKRNLERLVQARNVISYGKISGSVGTYANINPFVEEYVCKKLGLKAAGISSQVLQRDRHAQYLSTVAIVGTSLEKFATEFRSLQRTEIGEVQEFFSPTQKGSSSMPHKRNPIICERICGLARVLRANALAGMENMPLWHERDISHSSAERVIVPDSTILLDYMLNKMVDLVDRLVVNTERMKKNLELSRGIIFSQRILLELVNKGLTRIEAYDIVQRCSTEADQKGEDLKTVLINNAKVREYFSAADIERFFDIKYHLRYVDKIFKKVGI